MQNVAEYCNNNPSNSCDTTGQASFWGVIVGVAEIVAGVFTAPYDKGATLV